MGDSEQSYLLDLWDKNICPNCGKTIPEGMASGKRQEK